MAFVIPRCEAEVTHGNAIVSVFDQCARNAVRQVAQDPRHPDVLRWVCTQHGKSYDKGSLNGFVGRVEPEPDPRVDTMKDWYKRDRDIAAVIRAALGGTGCDTIDVLRSEQPAVFDELYGSLEAMVQDIPIHKPPAWLR